jgi:hypothetical protein
MVLRTADSAQRTATAKPRSGESPRRSSGLLRRNRKSTKSPKPKA